MALPRMSGDELPSVYERVEAAIRRFDQELAPRLRGDGRREDQLRAPVYSLMKSLGQVLGRDTQVHDEVDLAEFSSRPDFAVDVPSGRVGYIELKRPEKGIPGTSGWKPDPHDRKQFINLSGLPNLIYTSGESWGLYRRGELVATASLPFSQARRPSELRVASAQLVPFFHEFLAWNPSKPTSLKGLIADVAPLCRILRSQVLERIAYERQYSGRRPLATLAEEWRSILFPRLTGDEFADAYAQTVTFALLLARVDGISFDKQSLYEISRSLWKSHSLMGEALAILTDVRWVSHLSVVEMLRRVIGNIDWDIIGSGSSNTYVMLYESFLAEYDPALRRSSGTYYTPDPVARAMVRLSDLVLKNRLGKKRGFAADDVIVVDPAMGAGTFLVEIIESVVSTLRMERGSDSTPAAHLRELFAKRLVGFELHVAPFAVAEMRLHHTLKQQYGVDLPREEVRFLSDTLDDPNPDSFDFGQLYDALKETRAGANAIKREKPVMVVIGNPPWRERSKGEAPWLEEPRAGVRGRGGVLSPVSRPSMDDFRMPGQGRREFNLSNMWTFFWRWATWKVFDANPSDPAGIVVLITPSAYLSSDSHAGMRRYLRRTVDEAWILDVTPEGFQSDSQTRLFPGVQQPICIGLFVRYGAPNPAMPAKVHHRSIWGNQEEKFCRLSAIQLNGPEWEKCPNDWTDPFLPRSSDWALYPALADLFPWQQPGVMPNRNWVQAPDKETLLRRWARLIRASPSQKRALFKETGDRTIDHLVKDVPFVPSRSLPIGQEAEESARIARIGFRSFDRQYLILDRRVIDRPRPELWQVSSDRQVYTGELHTHALRDGPAIAFSALVPASHYLVGHHGGRVLPLFRDSGGCSANVLPGLLSLLEDKLGLKVSPEDLLAYVGAVVAHSGYTRRFRDDLRAPGVRVPLTAEASLWNQAVRLGREVIWLHTYGERYVDELKGRPLGAPRLDVGRRPRYEVEISADEERMPDSAKYDPRSETIIFVSAVHGEVGRVSPVPVDVWKYNVGGGAPVVQKWLDYRWGNPRRRKRTSELDDINPVRWTAQFDDEFLDLLNVLGRCVELEVAQDELLRQICEGTLIGVSDLAAALIFPVPAPSRSAPRRSSGSDELPLEGL
jgi:Type ISP C-terminal specificity domain/N-6 DNA Methylase